MKTGNGGAYLLPSWRVFVTIRVLMGKYRILFELQEQTAQQLNPEPMPNCLLGMLLCI